LFVQKSTFYVRSVYLARDLERITPHLAPLAPTER